MPLQSFPASFPHPLQGPPLETTSSVAPHIDGPLRQGNSLSSSMDQDPAKQNVPGVDSLSTPRLGYPHDVLGEKLSPSSAQSAFPQPPAPIEGHSTVSPTPQVTTVALPRTNSPSLVQPPCSFPSDTAVDPLSATEKALLMSKVSTLTPVYHSRIDSSLVPRPFSSPQSSSSLPAVSSGHSHHPSPDSLPSLDSKGSSHEVSSHQFIQLSLRQIPATRRLQETSSLPLVAVVQPFPCLADGAPCIPLVNMKRDEERTFHDTDGETQEDGPVRCTRCQAYVSLYTQFKDDLSLAVCCFCGHTFSVPQSYQLLLTGVSSTAQFVVRRTSSERPELCCDVVDYVAPRYFENAFPGANPNGNPPPSVTTAKTDPSPGDCFILDTTPQAVACGFTAAAAGAIQYALDTLPLKYETSVAFMTYDNKITFYGFPASPLHGSDYVQAMVVSDVDAPFVPDHPNSFFISPHSRKHHISQFLERLRDKDLNPLHLGKGLTYDSCGNAALAAGILLLQSAQRLGTVHIFYASPPNIGLGAVTHRTSPANKTKAAKQASLASSHSLFYREWGAKLFDHGLSVDVYGASLSRHLYFDQLSYLSRLSGGRFHYYKDFAAPRDFTQLCYDVAQHFQQPKGFDCVLKLRCSRGLCIDAVFTLSSSSCPTHQQIQLKDPSTLRMPRIDTMGGTFLFTFQYDTASLEPFRYSYFQLACLYTTQDGQRRVRVVTLTVPLTTSLSAVYRHADMQPLLAYFIRRSVFSYLNHSHHQWKTELFEELIKILSAYRIHCAATSTSAQLILPDALKLLPLYVLSVFKHPTFRETSSIDQNERNFYLYRLANIRLNLLISWIYPHLYVLHRSFTRVNGEDLETFGTPIPGETSIHLPPTLPLSGATITTDGIYLLDNGFFFFLYIGDHVNPHVLNTVLGEYAEPTLAGDVDEEKFQGELGERIRRVLRHIKLQKCFTFPYQPLKLIHARSAQEYLILQHLVEDRQGHELPYLDFLCQIHREIHAKLEE